MAVEANLEIYRGEDATVTHTVTPTTDITGWTLSLTVKKNRADATAVLTKSGSISSAAGGITTFTLAAADTASLEPRVYQYDIQRTNSGYVSVLTTGKLTLLPAVRT